MRYTRCQHIMLGIISVLLCTYVANSQSLRFYATSKGTNSVLYQLSSVDASVTKSIGATGLQIQSIAWHPSKGTVWAAAGGALWSLDINTAAPTFIVALNDTNWVYGLTFSSTGKLSAMMAQIANPDIDNVPYLVNVNPSSGICTTFLASGSFIARYPGLAYDDQDYLWLMGGQTSNLGNITDVSNVGSGPTVVGGSPAGSTDIWPLGFACGANDLCYVLMGDPTQTTLLSTGNVPSSSGVAILSRTTGAITLVGRTGINVLRGFTVETLGVYIDIPSATQNVARSLVVYARPSFQVPITITYISSSNHDILVDSDLTITTIDTSSKSVAFTPLTQGVTKLTFTAVDARGRAVTNTLPIAILPSPVLPTPPLQVLGIVGKNGTLSLTDLQSLAATTLTATSTGDLQLWTDSTGVHWYSPSASSQTVTVTASNVYGGTTSVSFVVNSIASVACLSL